MLEKSCLVGGNLDLNCREINIFSYAYLCNWVFPYIPDFIGFHILYNMKFSQWFLFLQILLITVHPGQYYTSVKLKPHDIVNFKYFLCVIP